MKIIALILSAFLIFSALIGCSDVPTSDTQNTDTKDTTTQDTTIQDTDTEETTMQDTDVPEMLPDGYYSGPYQVVEDRDEPLTEDEMKSLIAKVPADRYETYPNMHNVPLSATLYKNGEIISIDPQDPRLIKLINFFNNSVFYDQCAYTLCFLGWDDLEEDVINEELRLELKYEPYGEDWFGPYKDETTRSDTIIVTNDSMSIANFTLINHDKTSISCSGDESPVLAAGYSPSWLFGNYTWVELFGF